MCDSKTAVSRKYLLPEGVRTWHHPILRAESVRCGYRALEFKNYSLLGVHNADVNTDLFSQYPI